MGCTWGLSPGEGQPQGEELEAGCGGGPRASARTGTIPGGMTTLEPARARTGGPGVRQPGEAHTANAASAGFRNTCQGSHSSAAASWMRNEHASSPRRQPPKTKTGVSNETLADADMLLSASSPSEQFLQNRFSKESTEHRGLLLTSATQTPHAASLQAAALLVDTQKSRGMLKIKPSR